MKQILIIDEFVGLRPKCYSYTIEGMEKQINIQTSSYYANSEKLSDTKTETKYYRRAKGVKRNYVEKSMSHNDYKRCLFGEKLNDVVQNSTFNIIKSNKHNVYSMTVKKVGLCCLENKRMVLNDNIHTLAIGHYKYIS